MAVDEGGPRPDVLARLAEGAPVDRVRSGPSQGARLLGIVLCVATAGAVLATVLVAGSP